MMDDSPDSAEIKDTDIIFDCPHCSKSLAIDYRGAGLTIPCTDCGKHVQVPIPDGMEITDIDSTEEEQELRILNLRRSLASAESRIQELEEIIDQLRTRRDVLEKSRSDDMYRFGVILEKADSMQKILEEALASLHEISEQAAQDDSESVD